MKGQQIAALIAAVLGASGEHAGEMRETGIAARDVAMPDASSGESSRRASGPPVGEEVV